MAKAEKFHSADLADLERQVGETEEQLFRFRFQMGMGQLEGLKKYRVLKKDRARMLTVLTARQAAGEVATPVAASAGKRKKK